MQAWQKELPEAAGSVTVRSAQVIELFRSAPFTVEHRTGEYTYAVRASYGDDCNNGMNILYVRGRVCVGNSNRESDYVNVEEVPAFILDSVPPEVTEFLRWNDMRPAGPWYYLENTVYLAGSRDCHGLLKGEEKPITDASGKHTWTLEAYHPDGAPVVHNFTGDRPPPPPFMRWKLRTYIGEGKPSSLDAARASAHWPEATDEELTAPNLEQRLRDRLPALLVRFKADLTRVGFKW